MIRRCQQLWRQGLGVLLGRTGTGSDVVAVGAPPEGVELGRTGLAGVAEAVGDRCGDAGAVGLGRAVRTGVGSVTGGGLIRTGAGVGGRSRR